MMKKIEACEDDVDFVLLFKLSRFGRNAVRKSRIIFWSIV